jgi:hypothetical protein
MIAAIVAPAGVRNIARMRACLVSGRVEVFGDECADRERGLDLLVARAAERAGALDLDLDLVMGSSEVMRRHPPHHLSPARANYSAGQDPEARIRHFKSPQQRSDRTRKPVKSEQDSCFFDSNHGLPRSVRIAFPLGRLPAFRSAPAAQSAQFCRAIRLIRLAAFSSVVAS